MAVHYLGHEFNFCEYTCVQCGGNWHDIVKAETRCTGTPRLVGFGGWNKISDADRLHFAECPFAWQFCDRCRRVRDAMALHGLKIVKNGVSYP